MNRDQSKTLLQNNKPSNSYKKLEIISETADFLVINKPSGLTVNRSDTTASEQTLQDLVDSSGKIKKSDDEIFKLRSGIVHRLDKETSGLLIIAKNPNSFDNLQSQFKERIVEKEYVALCHGSLQPKKGEINVPIGRLPWNRKRFGVLAGGREAYTRYSVIDEYRLKDSTEKLCLVRLYPKTGRTHQIRVHLKYINHPIFSDELYAGRKTAKNDRKLLQRVFLHAEKIIFNDPITNKKLTFEAELPRELMQLLEKLEKSNDN
jgi:23S rRNA pseudouridine1911/1915/1917 synthase